MVYSKCVFIGSSTTPKLAFYVMWDATANLTI
jgi:hypothetical protein